MTDGGEAELSGWANGVACWHVVGGAALAVADANGAATDAGACGWAEGGGGANEKGLAGADENATAAGGGRPCAYVAADDPVRGSLGRAAGHALGPQRADGASGVSVAGGALPMLGELPEAQVDALAGRTKEGATPRLPCRA